jgi:hypothetical protein
LNACHTNAYAAHVNRRLPEVAVVAWAESPSDQVGVAIRLSRSFFFFSRVAFGTTRLGRAVS